MADANAELHPLADIDRIIHAPARLMVMTYLYVVESAEYIFLMNITGSTWGNLSTHLSKLEEVLIDLNRTIGDVHYSVGITYFLRTDLADQIGDIWCMEIEPYLEEYFFDQPEKIAKFRWEKVSEKLLVK